MAYRSVENPPVHLNLTIITDGFDRDGGSDGAFRVPGPELHDVLGPAH